MKTLDELIEFDKDNQLIDNEFIQILKVGISLKALFEVIEDAISLFEAFQNNRSLIYQRESSVIYFFEQNQFYLEQQILDEVTKIYDREKTCGHDNCSFDQLYERIAQFDDVPSDADKHKLLERFQAIQERYSQSGLKEIRDKLLMHHDLESLDEEKTIQIDFQFIKKLVTDGKECVLYTLNLLGVEYTKGNKRSSFEKYDEAIKLLLG